MPEPIGVRANRPSTATDATTIGPPTPTPHEPSAAESADRAADAVFDARARVERRPRRRTHRIHPRALVNTEGREAMPRADEPGDIAINVRSFLPQESVGGGFSADARGFSVSDDGRSRIHSRVVVHEGEEGFSDQIEEGAYSDRTFHPHLGKGPIINTAEPTLDARVSAADDDGVVVAMQHSAADPLTPPGTPYVDVESAVSIRRTSPEHVQVDFRIGGDGFPATEAFVSDHEGNALFLGTHAIDEDQNVLELYGGADQVVIEGSLTVLTNADGTFRGVEHGGQKFSLEEWNARFENEPALLTD
jgi:hypothetical protein